MGLKHLKGLLNQITQDEIFTLAVLNSVSNVNIALLEEVHHRQDLPVVRHQSLADRVAARHKHLQNLEGD